MAAAFARGTSVPVERSKAEIERLVQKYGASHFFSGWEKNAAIIGFRMKERFVRFRLEMPDPSKVGRDSADKEIRRLWRVLALVLKAKLEAVASKVSDFETEFLGNVTLPNGRTIGEWAKPHLTEIYSRGVMPPMLPGGAERP